VAGHSIIVEPDIVAILAVARPSPYVQKFCPMYVLERPQHCDAVFFLHLVNAIDQAAEAPGRKHQPLAPR
jgi:hypothetical protein